METIEELKSLILKYDKDGALCDDDGFEVFLYDEDKDSYLGFDVLFIRDEELVLRSVYYETFFRIDAVLGIKDGKLRIKISVIETTFDDNNAVLDTSKIYLLSIEEVKVKKTFTNLIDGSITEVEK